MIKRPELKDTVDLMLSKDWRDRIRTEYLQTKIRYERLRRMVAWASAETLDFKPKCSSTLLEQQVRKMRDYLETLEERMAIEKIHLWDHEETEQETAEESQKQTNMGCKPGVWYDVTEKKPPRNDAYLVFSTAFGYRIMTYEKGPGWGPDEPPFVGPQRWMIIPDVSEG